MPRMCPGRVLFSIAAGVCACGLSAAAARGQEAGAAEAATPAEPADGSPRPSLNASTEHMESHRRWTVQFEPSAWWTSPGGRLRLPGTSGGGGEGGSGGGDEVRLERLNLDTPRFSPLGEVHINADPWLVSFSGAAYSLSRDETFADRTFRIGDVSVTEGDLLDVDFDYASAELTVGRRIYHRDFLTLSADPAMGTPIALTIYALGGVRLYDIDVSVRNASAGGISASQQFFVEPILGAKAVAEVAEDFTIDLQVSGGFYADSDRSASSLDISLAFTWRPHENVGVQLGWRQLLSWLEDGEGAGEFSFNGGLAGLYTGVVVSF